MLCHAHPRGAPPGTPVVLVGVNLDGRGLAGVRTTAALAMRCSVPQPEARVDNAHVAHGQRAAASCRTWRRAVCR